MLHQSAKVSGLPLQTTVTNRVIWYYFSRYLVLPIDYFNAAYNQKFRITNSKRCSRPCCPPTV